LGGNYVEIVWQYCQFIANLSHGKLRGFIANLLPIYCMEISMALLPLYCQFIANLSRGNCVVLLPIYCQFIVWKFCGFIANLLRGNCVQIVVHDRKFNSRVICMPSPEFSYHRGNPLSNRPNQIW
jgi:hypothetical protein